MTTDEINARYQAKVETAKAAICDPFELRLCMLDLLDAWRMELEWHRAKLLAITHRPPP